MEHRLVLAGGWVLALLLLPLATGCAKEEKKLDPENELVVELGGPYDSLQKGLQGASVLRAPEPKLRLQPRPEKEQKPEPEPEPKPQPVPEPPSYKFVTLQEGQTLYGLCRLHLGDGSRWREVARLNGWTEVQLLDLPTGQKVKLPLR